MWYNRFQKVSIFGIADPIRRTNAYEGDGTLFAVGFGGESLTRRIPAFQADMYLTGFVSQSATFREVFFGSLFTFRGSSSPELLTFAEQPEVQIVVQGESTNSSTKTYIGEGRISTLSGAAESATFNPKERETPITLYILTSPLSLGFSVSSARLAKTVLKETG